MYIVDIFFVMFDNKDILNLIFEFENIDTPVLFVILCVRVISIFRENDGMCACDIEPLSCVDHWYAK